MRAESNNETPSVKTNVIISESVTQIIIVTLRTILILRSIFRSTSLTMTGKTTGSTKPPPIGAAPPSGASTSPPTMRSVMGAPGSSATAPTPQGTPGKGSLAVKNNRHTGKLIVSKLEESLTTGTKANAKGKKSGKAKNNWTDKNAKPKGPEKVSLNELFAPDSANFKFYGSSKGDTKISNMET